MHLLTSNAGSVIREWRERASCEKARLGAFKDGEITDSVVYGLLIERQHPAKLESRDGLLLAPHDAGRHQPGCGKRSHSRLQPSSNA